MMTQGASAARLYARHAAAADRGAWSVERDVRWAAIDCRRAHARPEILTALRDAALIEAYHPVNLARLLTRMWDDVDAGVVFSLELYEGFKHFHALRMYLDAVGHEPAITDADIVDARRAGAAAGLRSDDLVERLVEFMLSEHLASYFFRRLGEQAEDEVLSEMLALIASDETRHAQSASDLLAKRIAADRSIIPRVLDAAAHFHHFGEEVVAAVPVAQPGDPLAIRSFAKRIERLCNVRLIDYLKATL
jgi:rubrerythrin